MRQIQGYQDLFALSIGGNKTYIEVGGAQPADWNNTYILETQHNWRGFSIELNKASFDDLWRNSERKNPIYWDDAINFDYVKALEENNLPIHLNYLSIDIDPPQNTFAALQKIFSQGITFDCITYEHDNFISPNPNYEPISRDYLEKNGYKVAVTNVHLLDRLEYTYETWYVRADYDYEPRTFDEWLKSIA